MSEQWFSSDYLTSRERFRAACEHSGVGVHSYENPHRGPAGEVLTTDVAWFGDVDATRLVLMISGTHGLEGLCGSGCQLGWIESGRCARLPSGTAVMMIHAINPYGVAWLQRETEEGVDLNRNFIDHDKPYPERPQYAQLHEEWLCPDRMGPRYDAARSRLDAFRKEHGQLGYVQAFLGGQYEFPDGMSFGGRSPTWSNRTLTETLQTFAGGVECLAVLDYHTGLGPYGHALMIVHDVPGGHLAELVSGWYGPSVWPVGSADPAARDFIAETGKGCRNALPGCEVIPVTVEFGTYDMDTEIRVIEDDLWLRHHGDRNSREGKAIKSALVEYFYPDDPYWREMVLTRSQQVVRQAIDGLNQ